MFTLLNFKVTHKGNSLYECKFSDRENNIRNDALTTLIIGENGSGKSYLLFLIAEFFRTVSDLIMKSKKTTPSFRYDTTYIKYIIDDNVIEIKRIKTVTSVIINNENKTLYDICLPNKILSHSFMVNDKFSYASDNIYEYLGVRATSNATYTSSIQKRVLSSIFSSLENRSKLEALKSILKFIDMKPVINLSCNLNRKTLFSRGLNTEVIVKKIDYLSRRKKFIGNKRLENLRGSVESLKKFVDYFPTIGKVNKNSVVYTVDLEDINLGTLSQVSNDFRLLEEIGVLGTAEISFFKEESFGFEYTSSGEKHFLYTMINLISNIEKNTLVLIDEPELSLHPSWQMKYINLLKVVIKQFKSAHCLLASHSHFMVSDLKPESSTLLALHKKSSDNGLHRWSEFIDHSTYSWSAENILYKVFNLRTTRNYYFEQELSELLNLISCKSDNITRIEELIQNFESMILDKADPLNTLIKQSRVYLEGNQYDL